MIRLKAWKDAQGFALEFQDNQLALSNEGLAELIEELQALEELELDDAEDSIFREICVDIEEE